MTSTGKLPVCPGCHIWDQYIGKNDAHGNAVRCRGCRLIAAECGCHA